MVSEAENIQVDAHAEDVPTTSEAAAPGGVATPSGTDLRALLRHPDRWAHLKLSLLKDADNYLSWTRQIKRELSSFHPVLKEALLGTVSEGEAPKLDTYEAETRLQIQQLVFSLLYQAVKTEPKLRHLLDGFNTRAETTAGKETCEVHRLWERMMQEFMGNAHKRLQVLIREEFDKFRFKPRERLSAGLERFHTLVLEMESLGAILYMPLLYTRLRDAMPTNTENWRRFHSTMSLYEQDKYRNKETITLTNYIDEVESVASTHNVEASYTDIANQYGTGPSHQQENHQVINGATMGELYAMDTTRNAPMTVPARPPGFGQANQRRTPRQGRGRQQQRLPAPRVYPNGRQELQRTQVPGRANRASKGKKVTFAGACFTCGMPGHKAFQCPHRANHGEVQPRPMTMRAGTSNPEAAELVCMVEDSE